MTEEHARALRRIVREGEVARWGWRAEAASPLFPFEEEDVTRLAVLVDGEVAGMVQYWEEEDPDYRHASIDVFLDPARHGRGLGRRVVATVARHLIDSRRHHRLTIDPAADNERAIRCYEAVGFRRVGVMRSYERDGDGWRDVLLMDLLAGELVDQPL